MTRILVAGIGNELFGDDGFGVAVVERLAERQRSAAAADADSALTFLNAGTRGFDLVSALIDGYSAAILVDATPRGGVPGTLYVLDPTPSDAALGSGLDVWLDPHRLDPVRALLLARSLGAPLSRILVVGCEPAAELEMSSELSPAVAAAVEPAMREVDRLAAELARGAALHA